MEVGVKFYWEFSYIYFNYKSNFDDKLMLIISGLWNLYLIVVLII